MIPINMNEQIQFELTDSGKLVYEQYMSQFKGVVNLSEESLKAKDKMGMTLWEFMQIFGPHCYMGNPAIPFTKENSFFIDVSSPDL